MHKVLKLLIPTFSGDVLMRKQKEPETIRPGGEHGLNKAPHYSPREGTSLGADALASIVLSVGDRRVKVVPYKSFAWITGASKLPDGYYSRLLLDEVAEGKGGFKPVNNGPLRRELLVLLEKQHKLHPNRF